MVEGHSWPETTIQSMAEGSEKNMERRSSVAPKALSRTSIKCTRSHETRRWSTLKSGLEAAFALGEDDVAVSGGVRKGGDKPMHDFCTSGSSGLKISCPVPPSVSRACARRLQEHKRTRRHCCTMGSRCIEGGGLLPTVPAQFAAELTSVRECVPELRRERDDLRA